MRHRIGVATCWIIMTMLIVGNVVMLLPERLTAGLFSAPSMSPAYLALTRCHENPTDVIVFDPQGRIIAGWAWVHWPVPVVEDWMNARRIDHLARVGKIALIAKSRDGEIFHLGTWNVKDVRHPKEGPMYFVLPDALDAIPAGEYDVQITLYADPPWGQGLLLAQRRAGQFGYHLGATREEHEKWVEQAHLGPAIPGQFVVRTMGSDRLTVVIEEPQD